jgi:hypothetical protein
VEIKIREGLYEPLSVAPAVEPVQVPLKESMLESTFRILREEIIDNYMMNDDTIALSVTDYGFLDTSTKPLRLR